MPNPTESAVQPGKTAFHAMTREQLLLALEMFAKNWLAHDGCWFLAAEQSLGMDAAIVLDTAAWQRFAATEASRIMTTFGIPPAGGLEALERALGLRQYSLLKSEESSAVCSSDLTAAWQRFAETEASRIMTTFGIPPAGGLEALERALGLRQYSLINSQRTEWAQDGTRLRLFMDVCRVQETRRRKGLPDFPCKPVGTVEFETFARTVDPRIQTRCLHCPPESPEGKHCGWEFSLNLES